MSESRTSQASVSGVSRARRAIAWALALAGAAAVAGFVVGRVASDRWQVTQYLHWLPGVPTLVGVVLALVMSRVVWRGSAPGPSQGLRSGVPGRGLRRVRGAGACVCLFAAAWIVLVEWRAWNVLRTPPAPGAGVLSIVHFNASGKPAPALPGGVLALDPDVVIFANLRDRESLPATLEALSKVREGMSVPSLVHADRFTCVSRVKIREFGHTTLGFDGAIFMNRDLPDLRDPGTAAWFRLATGDSKLGRDLVVWAIDLPSDPRLGRWEVMKKSMDVIEAWSGPTWVRMDGGNYGEVAHSRDRAPGFPTPDVIIGDFNTPGGSAAIAELARRAGKGGVLRDAQALAGVGADGSFPGFLPKWVGWGIDRALVSQGLDVVKRDVDGVGFSQHRAQRVIVSVPHPSDGADPAASRTPPRP